MSHLFFPLLPVSKLFCFYNASSLLALLDFFPSLFSLPRVSYAARIVRVAYGSTKPNPSYQHQPDRQSRAPRTAAHAHCTARRPAHTRRLAEQARGAHWHQGLGPALVHLPRRPPQLLYQAHGQEATRYGRKNICNNFTRNDTSMCPFHRLKKQ